jgi:hypothetical protein
MAGKIYVGGQVRPSGATPLIPAGNASNIQPPQLMPHGVFATGPQHIPQAPYPFPRIPIKLPWGAGNGRGIA